MSQPMSTTLWVMKELYMSSKMEGSYRKFIKLVTKEMLNEYIETYKLPITVNYYNLRTYFC